MNRHGVMLFVWCVLGVVSCGENAEVSQTAQDVPESSAPLDAQPPSNTPELHECTGENNGDACDDGNPCTVDDTCQGLGNCQAGSIKTCAETDDDPCTSPVCDIEYGSKANGYCVERPITSAATENACFAYTCEDGVQKQIGPSKANDCASWEIPENSCIDQYVCDLQYTDESSGSHCRPVFKANGTACFNNGVGVKAASNAASTDAPSECLLYVCHTSTPPNTAEAQAQCVLSSTLPEDVQAELKQAGSQLDYSCHLDDMPQSINPQCNAWRCGCQDDTCQAAECQVDPTESQVGKACNNGNACDASVCKPGKESGAYMTCETVPDSQVSCDLFPNATCDVIAPCSPETGCPTTMDIEASNAKCQVNNACIDAFNTKCAPNDPNADPTTGCVVSYKPAGSPCQEALKDGCVLSASCQALGESMKCEVTQWVDCNDNNPCTKDFCADGQCQYGPLPGNCDDNDACTGNDQCKDQKCVGEALVCNDGLDCTQDSCHPTKGCQHQPQNDVCNDNNVCTNDSCDPQTGCVNAPNAQPCDDGSLCTLEDTCSNGVCTPGQPLQCDNGLFCDGKESCNPTTGCVPGTAPIVDDGNKCTLDSCDEATQQVVHTPAHSDCDDGQFCTGIETCNPALGCQPGVPPVISDGIECTVDVCDESTDQILHITQNAVCDDGNLCNGQEQCTSNSGCVPGKPVVCDDGDLCNGQETCNPQLGCQQGAQLPTDDGIECTVDTCNPSTGEITHKALDSLCDDAQFCNGTEVCDSTEGCIAGQGPKLDDNNSCTIDLCDENLKTVSHTPSDALCDDGQFCTGKETCDATKGCLPGKAPTASDNFDCTVDVCNEATDSILHIPQNSACNDGNLCNGLETCSVDKGCVQGKPLSCDDGNACNGVETCTKETGCTPGKALVCNDGDPCNGQESCSPQTGCVIGKPLSCDDGNACNGQETCTKDAGCTPGKPLNCNDGNVCNGQETCVEATGCKAGKALECIDNNPCTNDECSPKAGCLYTPNTNPCNDNNQCTTTDVCDKGVCTGSVPLECDDKKLCTTDSCMPGKGCVYINNTALCDDGDVCTQTDICDSGACKGAGQLNCADDNPCTDDTCNPKMGCQAIPNSTTCDDGSDCTTNDTCALGQCQPGKTITCDDGKDCTQDTCKAAGGCTYTPIQGVCDDGDACTTGTTCTQGECTGGQAVTCNDNNDCTDDKCVVPTGCTFTANQLPCDDGNPCTQNDVCSGGVCAASAKDKCDDNNSCTIDACDAKTGACTYTNQTDNAVCGVGTICWLGQCISDCTATPGSATFQYTQSMQSLLVPKCVKSVNITVYGAQGGGNYNNSSLGGTGGSSTGNLKVKPGDVLYVYVGGSGQSGGWNGGAPNISSWPNGWGGGATDVRLGGQTLQDRVIVAGGGGGEAAYNSGYGGWYGGQGGNGGGSQGVQGGASIGGGSEGKGGQGGTQSDGGQPGKTGSSCCSYLPGQKGTLGSGGKGAGEPDGDACGSAGSGGGGYYGGGGGGHHNCGGGGGGGGSGYIGGVTNGSMTTGGRTGNGMAYISWQ